MSTTSTGRRWGDENFSSFKVNLQDLSCIGRRSHTKIFFSLFSLFEKPTNRYSNIQPIEDRESRTGIPDRFCLLAIYRNLLNRHLPKINYLIQGKKLQFFVQLFCNEIYFFLGLLWQRKHPYLLLLLLSYFPHIDQTTSRGREYVFTA